jgi:DNA ligase-1
MRVFPKDGTPITEKGKSYIVFQHGTGVMLADHYDKAKGHSPVGWFVSEKYDGLRGLWTGAELVARPAKKEGVLKGKLYNYVPDHILAMFPKGISLDGEIWMGRGKFQQVSGLSNLKISKHHPQHQIDATWARTKFMAFDLPHEPLPYEGRRAKLESIVADIHRVHGKGFIDIAPIIQIKSSEHLKQTFESFVRMGAEGVILRQPASLYETCRSKQLLKMKIQDDTEAKVLNYEMGEGKYTGMLGALLCQMSNMVTFKIGTGFTDDMRSNYNKPDSVHYIPIGATINFSYMELTQSGVPRHPVYRGVRQDVLYDLKLD